MNQPSPSPLDTRAATPLYLQLHDRLLGQIRSGQIRRGEALPGIKKLAAEAGVSIITAEAALQKLISSGICYRRPKKGTFVGPAIDAPPVSAPSADSGGIAARRAVVVFSPYVIEECTLLNPLNHGIHAEARENGWDILHISGDLARQIDSLDRNPGIDICGVIVLACADLTSLPEIARNHPRLRFILTNYQIEDFESTPANLFGVFSEEFGGGYTMTRYLLQQGCRRIAVIYSRNADCNYAMRIAGYRRALEEAGIPFDPALLCEGPHNPPARLRETGRQCIAELLGRTLPDAVFGLNDQFTAGAAEYLRDERPDLAPALAGYDNFVPEISIAYGFPTVEVDTGMIGRTAVKLLREAKPPVKSLRLPPTLIQR